MCERNEEKRRNGQNGREKIKRGMKREGKSEKLEKEERTKDQGKGKKEMNSFRQDIVRFRSFLHMTRHLNASTGRLTVHASQFINGQTSFSCLKQISPMINITSQL